MLSLPLRDRPPSPPPSIATSPLLISHSIDTNQPPSAASSLTSDSTFLSASSEFVTTAPTTPDDHSSLNPFDQAKADDDQHMMHRNSSESTIQKTLARSSQNSKPPETVIEEETPIEGATPVRPPFHRHHSTTSSLKGPPAYPARTPVRTKRRSVSSTLSEPASPTSDKPLAPLPPQNFSSLLNTPAPMIFSTPLERELLNSLSILGLNTTQIVHSVLNDACDAAGALWWMLKRRSEKRIFDDGHVKLVPSATIDPGESDSEKERERQLGTSSDNHGMKHTVSVQTDPVAAAPFLSLARSAPELAFVPPTPTVPSAAKSTTPPRTISPMGRLSPLYVTVAICG